MSWSGYDKPEATRYGHPSPPPLLFTQQGLSLAPDLWRSLRHGPRYRTSTAYLPGTGTLPALLSRVGFLRLLQPTHFLVRVTPHLRSMA